MATAKVLDVWVDHGMAFSEEEVMGFSITRAAENRLLRLIEIQNIVYNYWLLCEFGNIGARAWSSKAYGRVQTLAGYLCVAANLDSADPSDFSRDDKEFVVAAQEIEFIEEWVAGLIDEIEGLLRREVTLARAARVQQNLGKPEVRLGNKYFNAVLNQRAMFEDWKERLASFSLRRRSDME